METVTDNLKPDDAPADVVSNGPNDLNETPAEPPSDPISDLDRVLAEYDQGTVQPTPDPTQPSEIDQILAAYGDDTAIKQQNDAVAALQNEVSSLRAQEQARIDQADFERACTDLQRQCGPHVDDHYAERELKSALVDRPELLQVWRNRNVTPDKIQAADREFRQLEAQYNRVQLAPDSPQKQQALAEMQQRGYALGLLMNTPKIISQLRRQVIDRAAKAPLPVDPDATLDRALIVQAIKEGGSGRAAPPQPQVNLGRLTAQEYRNYVRENFGFDSGI
jgi:hypothetical protein